MPTLQWLNREEALGGADAAPYRLLVEEAGRSRAWLLVGRKTGAFATSRFDGGGSMKKHACGYIA